MDTEPIAVGLKFGFLAVLYLFLFWVGRSRSRSSAARQAPAPEATGFHDVAGPGGRAPSTDASLVAVKGGGLDAGSRWDLFGGLSIGRGDEADVRIDDKFASAIHCRIYSRGPSYYVEDMGSTNGTYLNGGRFDAEALLSDLDEIRIGDTELRFEIDVPGSVVDGSRGSPRTRYKTDTGRQRTTNEDSYFARGPLYAVADGMGGAQAGEVASRHRGRGLRAGRARLRAARGLPALRGPEREQPDPLALPARLEPLGHGNHAHRGARRGRRDLDRPRRRLARLPLPRRRAEAPHLRPLARRGAPPPRPPDRGGGRDHPQRSIITRALGPEAEVEVDTLTVSAPPRRRLPDLLGRPHHDGQGRQDPGDPRRVVLARRGDDLARERGERGRRARQHHRRRLPPGRGRSRRRSKRARPWSARPPPAAGLSAEAVRTEAERRRAASLGGAASGRAAAPPRARRAEAQARLPRQVAWSRCS